MAQHFESSLLRASINQWMSVNKCKKVPYWSQPLQRADSPKYKLDDDILMKNPFSPEENFVVAANNFISMESIQTICHKGFWDDRGYQDSQV